MLVRFAFLAACTLLATSAAAQVCEGTRTIYTQQDADAFACTEVTGSLVIMPLGSEGFTPPSDLSRLAMLERVEGGLAVIGVPELTSLDALASVSFGGDVWVEILRNPALTDLDGLAGMRTAEGLRIEDNLSLTDLDGLAGLSGILAEDLIVSGNAALTSISGLAGITEVRGWQSGVRITDNPLLTSLDGLQSIAEFRSSLAIAGNDALLDLDALSEATYRSDVWVGIANNASLLQIDGLSGLTQARTVDVTGNAALRDLGGLSNLAETAFLAVVDNDALTDLSGLESLAYVDDRVYIIWNDGLRSLAGLDALAEVGKDLYVYENAGLQNLDGLSSLFTVGGSVVVRDNPALERVDGLGPASDASIRIYRNGALRDLSGLGASGSLRSLAVFDNEALTSPGDLTALERITGSLWLFSNPALETLSGLDSLRSVDGLLVIGADFTMNPFDPDSERPMTGNASLADVSALNGLESLGGLYVEDNEALADCSCAFGPLLPALLPDTSAVIGQNAPGGSCNTPEAVLAAYGDGASCERSTAAEPPPSASSALYVMPNPATAEAEIGFALAETSDARLTVYDLLGRRVAVLHDGPAVAVRAPLDVQGLSPGLYVARLTTASGRREAVRFTVAR